jgi:hypothetical protein
MQAHAADSDTSISKANRYRPRKKALKRQAQKVCPAIWELFGIADAQCFQYCAPIVPLALPW